jgi:hypothetical protein
MQTLSSRMRYLHGPGAKQLHSLQTRKRRAQSDPTVSYCAPWANSTIAEFVCRVTRIVSTVVQDQRTISDQTVAALAIRPSLKKPFKW